MDVLDVHAWSPTRAVRLHLRRGRAGDDGQARDGAAAVVRRRVRRRAAQRRRPVRGEGRPALRQPADRPVLRGGCRARGHPGAALRRPGAGPRLGRVGDDPVLRRADQHRPRRRPCRTRCPTRPGSTSWTGPGARSRSPPGTATTRVELPLEPMLGTVGVAPAGGEVRSSLVPDRFGGNMDTPRCGPAQPCFLGVNVEGALFSVGDGHYRQGEGEACGTAVEGAMTTTLIVDLVKGGAPAWPRHRGRHALMTVGSSRPLEDAWRIGQRRDGALGRRALRPGPDGRLPAGLAGRAGAGGQRGGRQLQRRGQDAEVAAAGRRRRTAACTTSCAPARAALSRLPIRWREPLMDLS